MHRSHSSPPPPTRSCHLPNNGVWAFHLLSYCVTQHAPSTIHPIIAGMDHLGRFKTNPHKSLSPSALPLPVIFRGPRPLSTELLFWSLLKDYHLLVSHCFAYEPAQSAADVIFCRLAELSRRQSKVTGSSSSSASSLLSASFICAKPGYVYPGLNTMPHPHITCKRRCSLHYKGSGICRRIVQWQICIAWERKLSASSLVHIVAIQRSHWVIRACHRIPHVRQCASSSSSRRS